MANDHGHTPGSADELQADLYIQNIYVYTALAGVAFTVLFGQFLFW